MLSKGVLRFLRFNYGDIWNPHHLFRNRNVGDSTEVVRVPFYKLIHPGLEKMKHAVKFFILTRKETSDMKKIIK